MHEIADIKKKTSRPSFTDSCGKTIETKDFISTQIISTLKVLLSLKKGMHALTYHYDMKIKEFFKWGSLLLSQHVHSVGVSLWSHMYIHQTSKPWHWMSRGSHRGCWQVPPPCPAPRMSWHLTPEGMYSCPGENRDMGKEILGVQDSVENTTARCPSSCSAMFYICMRKLYL